jgi:hypothetical protein
MGTRWPAVMVSVLLGGLVSWGGGDIDASQPSGDTGEAPEDLSGELIAGPDLGGGWYSAGGPQPGELIEGSEPVISPCPDGETVELSEEAVAQASRGNASIELTHEDRVDDFVYEALHHDSSGELFEAFRNAWDSCVGQTWEQGDDPVENVRLESIEFDDLGDEASAYREEWGSGGEYYGTDLLAFARTRGVLVLIVVRAEDTAGSADVLFDAALIAAVAKLEDGTWNPGVLNAAVAPEVDVPAVIEVVEPGELIVYGNDGCELLGGETGYFLSDPGSFSDELPPNVQWFVEQVFDAHALSDVTVDPDRMYIAVYLTSDETGTEKLDDRATDLLAVELRQRLGNRSICL